MIFSPKQLADYLKLIRTQNNWSQAEVAQRVGVKQSTISNFENDPDRCQMQTFFKILQALNLTISVAPNKNQQATQDEDW
ncbi:type II toxin-antitoxin system antitoxin HipB [Bowmanella pacifica]|uniref:Transcriptional regulator n=1 Tax=Bowmanella pacifica TaxID=502051 RepID=A0A917YRV6_9ALTE|nr:transcriptional regulator [Bowmanella pacifica]